MGLASWLLFLALATLAGAYVAFLYSRREVRVGGLMRLAILRIASMTLVLLLLFDPRLPGLTSGPGDGSEWVLLDGSLSMGSPGASGSLWDDALARIALAPDERSRVLVFGDGIGVPGGEGGTLPGFTRSRLTEALERAAEAGARRVRLLSDLRFEDPVAARAALDRLNLSLVVERLEDSVRNAGIEAFRVPRAVRAGLPLDVEATLFAAGAAGDTVTVEFREEERSVASARVALPPSGGLASVRLTLPAPRDTATVRYTARVGLDGDRFPDDDERVAYTIVDPVEGNLVLVSVQPDWELRFLLPVLERVTGLPTRGFIRVGPDRFLAMAPGGAEGSVDRATVADQAMAAELLVLQGPATGEDAAWALAAVRAARRSILFPGTREGAVALGVGVGPLRDGEWYVSTELPPSPLAGELASAEVRGLPPVSGILTLSGEAPGFVPLDVRLRGTGPAEAALLLQMQDDGRRQAVALAQGFWRWAFRTPELQATYDRLWAGVAGWLLADEPMARGPGLRTEEPVVARGEGVRWAAPGHGRDTLELTVLREDSVAVDTVLTIPEGGRFEIPALEPGAYRYVGRFPGGDGAVEEDSGRFDVERYTGELLHPPVTELASPGPRASSGAGAAPPGVPLRTHPLPYLLLLTLLSAEWIGRRRRGLR